MTKTEFLNLKEKLIRARQDGYAAAIEEAIEIVSTASCDYEGQSKCIEKLEALLPKKVTPAPSN